MEKDLRLEVYASKKPVKAVALHVYQIKSNNITESRQKVMRSACWKARRYNQCGVFEDGKLLYSTNELTAIIPNSDFSLEYDGLKELSVEENKQLYASLIKYYIERSMANVLISDKYRKYSCKNNEITSKFIMTEKGFSVFNSNNKDMYLEREYVIRVEIGNDGFAYLYLHTKSNFKSNLSVAEYLAKGTNVLGMRVTNEWSKDKQSGTITEVTDKAVVDELDFGTSLKDYYQSRNEGYRVDKIEDDTPVVMVKLNEKTIYPYYPNALKPILSREVVEKMDPMFSQKIDKYVKRDMAERLRLDADFITDIGQIQDIGDLSFETECCDVERIGYKKGRLDMPTLICGNERELACGEEIKAFNLGFYKKNKGKIRIGYLYPNGTHDLMKGFVIALHDFGVKGKFHGYKDKYTCEGLLDLQTASVIQEEYNTGDITDYKRAALKVKKENNVDFVIAMVLDGMDDEGPYNPFKTILAEASIPSQMVSVGTAKKIVMEPKGEMNSKYILQNIVLGILGKTGGVPWIVKEMPGNVDCFVGLDVATVSAGIHFPACSVAFDKHGRLLGYYKPKQVQRGEIITEKILQDIFDQVLFTYEDEFGEQPKSIVIHRDGFSNENDDWYEKYFAVKGIEYTIVEVKKNINTKLVMYKNGDVFNPDAGYCVYNQNAAYLVTTVMKRKKGSPNPILLEKKHGNISMKDIITQVLYLSQLHAGSTQKMRLPITTGYADKICKSREYVPEGKMDNKLFFL